MARKKKQPATKVVSISLTTEDKLALGMQLANVLAQITALQAQRAEESARLQKLINDQIDIAEAVAAQIRGGTGERDQASLKVGETGELEVPEKPFADKCAHCGNDPKGQKYCSAACDRCDEKSAKGNCVGICGQRLLAGSANAIDVEAVPVTPSPKPSDVPPAVASAIAKNGGEVNLTTASAKNATTVLKGKGKGAKAPKADDAVKGPKQPPKAPRLDPVTVLEAPKSCPDCGSKVQMLDASGVYQCLDQHTLDCVWSCVVESAEATSALGPMGASA